LLKTIDRLGAIAAILFYVSAILVFIFRIVKKPYMGHWIGIVELCLIIPMVYLLIKAPEFHRPPLYYVQVGLFIAWLILELFLDYIFKVEFRQTRWMVIAYVTLFFAGAGGLIGIAWNAGKAWGLVSIALFLAMAALAFIQRSITGT
jgi:hypothetical protein